jgi:hypothetical protein
MRIAWTWGCLVGVLGLAGALLGAGCMPESGVGPSSERADGSGGSKGGGGAGGRGGSTGGSSGGFAGSGFGSSGLAGAGGASGGSSGLGGSAGAGGAGTGGSGGVDAPVLADAPAPEDAATDTRPEPPASAIPAPWKGEDIGDIGLPGSSGRTRTTFQIKGSGGDIWGQTDGFHFLHRPVRGDLEMVARLASMERPNQDAKAGLMFRETTATDSRNVSLLVFPGQARPDGTVMPGKGSRLQFRDKRVDTLTGFADLVSVRSGTADAPPMWLRLSRRGNLFEGFVSGDGLTWLKDGEATLASSPAELLAGLAVTSHTSSDASLAVFEGLRLTALTDAAWAHAELGTLGGFAAGAPRGFELSNAGRGLSNDEDGVTFVHRRNQHLGDVEITARVTELRYTGNRPARVGLMLRGMLRGDARMVAFVVELSPTRQRYRLQRRAQDGGNVSTTEDMTLPPPPDAGASADLAPAGGGSDSGPDAAATPAMTLAPVWLKLVRVGHRFVGFVSSNGRTWRAAVDLPSFVVASNAFVGVALTSGDEGATASGRIENLTIAAPTTMLPQRPDAAVPDADGDAMP